MCCVGTQICRAAGTGGWDLDLCRYCDGLLLKSGFGPTAEVLSFAWQATGIWRMPKIQEQFSAKRNYPKKRPYHAALILRSEEFDRRGISGLTTSYEEQLLDKFVF